MLLAYPEDLRDEYEQRYPEATVREFMCARVGHLELSEAALRA